MDAATFRRHGHALVDWIAEYLEHAEKYPVLARVTPGNIAAELHELLDGAGIKPPYILVGHSFGGLVMRRFALMYPEEVASVMLIDPMRCEEWPPLDPTKQAMIDRGLKQPTNRP